MSRRSGFTLIELLVVIAIIGILAAMLFPVFARAREAARKIQCLSNVKNVALAFNMYLTDYDKFPPAETDAEVNAFFSDCYGDSTNTAPGCCSTQANPYLRWPVILDEYIKNRDIWRCPSAKMVAYPKIIISNPNWFQSMKQDAPGYCPCGCTWPPGWGGTATDTNINSDTCVAPGSRGAGEVQFGICMYEGNLGMSAGAVQDATQYVIVADANNEPFWGQVEQVAFPEVCRTRLGNADTPACAPDWENDCGDPSCSFDDDQLQRFWTDVEFRKQYTRHMGGSNLGFMDGHAKWWSSEAIINAADAVPQQLLGVSPPVN